MSIPFGCLQHDAVHGTHKVQTIRVKSGNDSPAQAQIPNSLHQNLAFSVMYSSVLRSANDHRAVWIEIAGVDELSVQLDVVAKYNGNWMIDVPSATYEAIIAGKFHS